MLPEEKILYNWIVALENYDQFCHTHFSDELKKLLEPEGQPMLHLFAKMLANEAGQYWDIAEKILDPGPKTANQMMVERWIKEHQARASEEE